MAYGKISDKQREILEYIKQEILNSLIDCLKIRLIDYEDIIKEGLDNAKSSQNS